MGPPWWRGPSPPRCPTRSSRPRGGWWGAAAGTVVPGLAAIVFHGGRAGMRSPAPPPSQPAAVLAALGEGFERLSGDQVVTSEDGWRELVATARYSWPEPQCGGGPLPLL